MKLPAFKSILLMLVLTGLASASSAQAENDTTERPKRVLIAGIPILFYTPETRFGYGLSGFCIFNFRKDTLLARRSSVSLGFAYTQNKQMLFYLPYNLFLSNRMYHLYGELAFNRYHYNFYGTGNKVPPAYEERYGVEFPRLRFTALRKVRRNLFLGPRYAFDRFRLFDLAEGGLLAASEIKGSEGGIISGVGAVMLYDSRDYIFYPSKGMLWEIVVYRDHPLTGSSFDYTRLAFDMSKYFSYREKNILALNIYSIFSDTDLPFFQMGMLGGLKKMRGFYEGRYRDNNLLLLQAEYRRHLFWQLHATLFGSAGQVARRYHLFHHDNWKYTYGAGLRVMLDKAQRINLRVDFAVGNGQILSYFTVGEAF